MVRAWIDGDRLRVQHGYDPEPVSHLTLDELIHVGGHRLDGNVVLAWCTEIDLAPDGATGLQAFRGTAIDLVLCDLFMPEVDGFEVLRELRRRSASVRVIAMSGGGFHGTVDLLPVARQLGAAEILEKPFGPRALLQAVARVLTPSSDEG